MCNANKLNNIVLYEDSNAIITDSNPISCWMALKLSNVYYFGFTRSASTCSTIALISSFTDF
jgi:hypothetical protein